LACSCTVDAIQQPDKRTPLLQLDSRRKTKAEAEVKCGTLAGGASFPIRPVPSRM